LLEKGCPEPTDEEYAGFVAKKLAKEQQPAHEEDDIE
jgi:hypothetical protein